jgi:DNA-binding MarR family transcriptional regulator
MSDPSPQNVAASLRRSIGTLSWVMRKQRTVTDLGGQGLGLLSRLYRDGAQSPVELAAAEAVQPQSLTRPLAALEEAGLIRRTEHPTDGRKVIVDLTPEGLAALEADALARGQRLAELIAATTTEDERATLLASSELMERLGERWATEHELGENARVNRRGAQRN